ncbi:hypothetical protein QLR68_34365, partial [Micromonospora sp. DH15]|nr:hypothetical protein [Micromonospora sp. DH15]
MPVPHEVRGASVEAPVLHPVRRGVRRLLAALCLLPLIALLARQLPQLPYAPLAAYYGFAVLTATV